MHNRGEHVTRSVAARTVAPRCAVLIGASVLFAVLGRNRLALVLLVAAVAWAVIAVAVPSAVGRIDALLARFGRAVGDVLSTAISILAMVLVILPLSFLSKLVRASPIDSGWTSADTAWVSTDGRHGGAAGSAARAGRMAAVELRTSPGVRWRMRARNVLGVAAVGLLVFGAVNLTQRDDGSASAKGSKPIKLLAGFDFNTYAFQDEPWAYDLYQQLDKMPVLKDLVLGYSLGDHYESKYVNIDHHRRVTRQPKADPQLTVWFFGGSTMFGLGQRDDHTIASEISALAEADGVPAEVVNFGVPGYTNWVEFEQYLQALSTDLAPPDLVVFYDGINDLTLARQRVDIGDVDPQKVSFWPQTDEGVAIFNQSVEHPVTVPDDEKDDKVVEIGAALYGRGIRAVRRVSDAAGIESRFYWQPTLQSKKPSPIDLPVFEQINGDQRYAYHERKVYNAIAKQSGEDPINISTALDGATKPVLMDGVHTNERGARMIAEAMYKTLGPDLHRLASQDSSGG